MCSASCLLALLLLSHEARATEGWLTFTGSASCSASPEELASRILELAIGSHDPKLRVEIDMLDGTEDTAAMIRLTLGSRRIGSKKLVAATCEEALDAALAVVALALSSEPRATGTAEAAAPVTAPASGAADTTSPAAGLPEGDRSVEPGEPRPGTDTWRLLFAGGVEHGTLAEPTVVVGAGAAASIGRGELRAIGWYGLPSSREEVSAVFESTRSDFAAAALDYCGGIDRERWLGLCGGLEAGLTRLSRVRQAPNQPRTEQEDIGPSLGVVMGLSLAYRDSPLMPRLDLSARLPLVGRLAEAPAVGFRAALGAGMPF